RDSLKSDFNPPGPRRAGHSSLRAQFLAPTQTPRWKGSDPPVFGKTFPSISPPRIQESSEIHTMSDQNAKASPSDDKTTNVPTTGTGGTPSDFLKQVVGHQVTVRLNSGVDYRGILSCLDGYMNIALENTEEYVNGIRRNSYGDAFIRGNNDVSYIAWLKARLLHK
ncbi:hypothetical protein MJO29_000987, partial [Puccinia striiformis f. sp. tritici]